MQPVHADVCDAIMHACNEGVDSISIDLEFQKIAVTAEVKRKAEAEEQQRLLREKQKQEARNLMARLRELQQVGVSVDDKSNAVDILSDDDDVTHNPVRVIKSERFYYMTNCCMACRHAMPQDQRPFVQR
jgi:hypothetical protein